MTLPTVFRDVGNSPSRAPTFFLYGYYGCGNLGDDLLLSALAGELEKRFPGSKKLIRNFGPLPGAFPGMTATDIEQILADHRVPRLLRAVRYLWRFAKYAQRFDCLVLGGGTVISEDARASLLLLAAICAVVRVSGGRVVGLGMGISPLRTHRARLLLWSIVHTSKAFCVRDDASLAECRSAGCEDRVTKTADLAFILPHLPLRQHAKAPRTVAVSLAFGFFCDPKTRHLHDSLLDSLAGAIEAMKSSIDEVQLVSLQSMQAIGAHDEEALSRLAERLPRGLPVRISRLGPVLEEIAALFEHAGLLIGMRYHALLLAAIHGRPFVGIAHDSKVTEIARTFGMPALSVESINAQRLAQAAEEAWERMPSSDSLFRCAADAWKNFDALERAVVEE